MPTIETSTVVKIPRLNDPYPFAESTHRQHILLPSVLMSTLAMCCSRKSHQECPLVHPRPHLSSSFGLSTQQQPESGIDTHPAIPVERRRSSNRCADASRPIYLVISPYVSISLCGVVRCSNSLMPKHRPKLVQWETGTIRVLYRTVQVAGTVLSCGCLNWGPK